MTRLEVIERALVASESIDGHDRPVGKLCDHLNSEAELNDAAVTGEITTGRL